MRKTALLVLLASCVNASPPKSGPAATPPAPAPAPLPPPPVVDEGNDVRDEALALNSDKFPAPPKDFRAGHVTPRTLPAGSVKATGAGFAVQLPSRAPVTTPAVHGGRIFTSGGFHSKEFYAFDAKTGQLAWGLNLDDDGPSAPACAEGVCAFNTESCTLFTVDAETGRQLWSWWLGDPLMSAPAIADGRVYTSYPAGGHGKATHVLAAFELRTGKILWQKWIDSDVMSSPVVVDGEVWAATFAGTMLKLDAKTGEILSARRSRATSAPTVVAGRVYYSQRTEGKGEEAREAVVSQDKAMKKTAWRANDKKAGYVDAEVQSRTAYTAKGKDLDAANGFGGGAPASANAQVAQGTIGKGSVSTLQAHQGSRVVHAGGKNLSTMGDEVVAVDPTSGATLWSHKIAGGDAGQGGAVASAPAVAGGRLFVATLAGEVQQIDLATGKLEKTYPIGSPVRSQPVVEDGWIYVGTEDGRLVAIATGDTGLGGWPMWGGDAARKGSR